MATGHEEHSHEHRIVEIIETDTIAAFEQSPHPIITLELRQRGFSLDLTYQEVVVLAEVMEKVVEHVNAKRQQ